SLVVVDRAGRVLRGIDANRPWTPRFSPDGRRVAYGAFGAGRSTSDIWVADLETSATQRLTDDAADSNDPQWSPDGKVVAYSVDARGHGQDVLVQPADGSAPTPYVATAADETAARVSPDGRWIAYTSNASGRDEVYLDSYPRSTHRVPLSRSGGIHPVWRGDGKELYYWREDRLIAVPVSETWDGAPPKLGGETVLFTAAYQTNVNTM